MKLFPYFVILLVLVLAMLTISPSPAQSDAYNDHMFPPSSGASSSINFDSKGFVINGKRTFLVSGGMEYARVPRALWRDRLLRMKRAGFNCVETYVFWNFHEPEEGHFVFSGDHDLGAYLKLIHEMGMFAIVRVGPYCCAEWDSGGYPIWLRFKPGLSVRVDNKPFEVAVDNFFDKMLPIVAANQINRGGSVILVQLENEYPLGWTHTPSEGYGTNIPNNYFQNLHDEAVANGIEVPFFFSGMHHGSDPGEYNGGRPFDDPTRPNPWITTEFWSVWFSNYGQPAGERSDYGTQAATYSRRTWRILANGGNGYNYYMAHGGSNFGYSNADVDAASYDYGAAIGQAGDLRPTYYAFKKIAYFARSFQEILENSTNDASSEGQTSSNSDVSILTRKSPAGTISFLDNPSHATVQTTVTGHRGNGLTDTVVVSLSPGELMPIVSGFKLCPDVTLDWSPTRLLGVVKRDNVTTIVAYGATGTTADLNFMVAAPMKILRGAGAFSTDANGHISLSCPFSNGGPVTYEFTAGTQTVRIVCVNSMLADKTWFVGTVAGTYIVCGADYAGEASMNNKGLVLLTEEPWQPNTGSVADINSAITLTPDGRSAVLQADQKAYVSPLALPLSSWEYKSAISTPPANPSGWLFRLDAPQMGADGDLSADAWYQTTVQIAQQGRYMMTFVSAADRLSVYVDGKLASQTDAPRNTLVFDASAGSHTLTVFVAHDGRPDFFPWLGPITTKYAKGLLGPALLYGVDAPPAPVTGWKVLKLSSDPGPNIVPPIDVTNWTDYSPGDNIFGAEPGYAWLQTTIVVDGSGGRHTSLHCDGIDNNGRIFLNGKMLDGIHGVNEPFDVPLGDGSNTVSVLWQNTYDNGGISPMTVVSTVGDPVSVTGWFMKGGPGNPAALDGWLPPDKVATTVGPAFYRASFVAAPPGAVGPHPIWRVVTKGLGHGSVWVNGHNLGRYPEKINVNGLYIPECWLTNGKNSLVVYDEDGRRPDQVAISAELAASRTVVKMVEVP